MFCHMETYILELDGLLRTKLKFTEGTVLYPDRLCCVLSVVESLHPKVASASAILTDEGSLVYF